MSIITQNDLVTRFSTGQSINFARQEQELKKTAGFVGVNSRVFLSHSHLDKELVVYTIRLLQAFGGKPYIDWLDPEMPQTTCAETAMKIRAKIKDCDHFILLASEDANNSHWVPWELGYADAIKTFSKIAILPVQKKSGEYHGSEYMRIYPSIRTTEDDNFAIFPNGETKGIGLDDWLSSK